MNDVKRPDTGTFLNKEYDHINPAHYSNYSVEVIDMMISIFGAEETAIFCELNAFKYRMRAGTKPSNSVEQDLEKEKWYLTKAANLRAMTIAADKIEKTIEALNASTTKRP